MKALFLSCLSLVSAALFAQNHTSQSIRMIVEQEHDHIANFDSYVVRAKLFNPQNEILYEADIFNGREMDETFYYYNELADIYEERRICNSLDESGMVEFEYDDDENLIRETEYDHGGKPTIEILMKYEKGLMVEKERWMRHEGSIELYLESKYTYEHDEAGRVKKQHGFESGKSDHDNHYQFWYENGGLTHTKERLDDEGTVVERWIDRFSKDNHPLEYKHTAYIDGKEHVRRDVKFTYNEHGDVLAESISKEGKVVQEIKFEYSYDNHGNYTSKKEFKGLGDAMEEVATITRWIEYYEDREYAHPPMELDETFNVVTNEKTGKREHVSAETHVRINNNDGKVIWQVRRNGPNLYQVDYNQYVRGLLIQSKHVNHFGKENYYTNYSYNSKNQLTEELSYNYEEEMDGQVKYEYSEDGKLLKKEVFMPNRGGYLVVEIIEKFEYDEHGHMHKSLLSEYGFDYTVDYIWDKDGNLNSKVVTPKAEGESTYSEHFHYENGKKKARDLYEGKKEKPVENDVFEHDDKGELIKSISYLEGEIKEVTLYEYFK